MQRVSFGPGLHSMSAPSQDLDGSSPQPQQQESLRIGSLAPKDHSDSDEQSDGNNEDSESHSHVSATRSYAFRGQPDRQTTQQVRHDLLPHEQQSRSQMSRSSTSRVTGSQLSSRLSSNAAQTLSATSLQRSIAASSDKSPREAPSTLPTTWSGRASSANPSAERVRYDLKVSSPTLSKLSAGSATTVKKQSRLEGLSAPSTEPKPYPVARLEQPESKIRDTGAAIPRTPSGASSATSNYDSKRQKGEPNPQISTVMSPPATEHGEAETSPPGMSHIPPSSTQAKPLSHPEPSRNREGLKPAPDVTRPIDLTLRSPVDAPQSAPRGEAAAYYDPEESFASPNRSDKKGSKPSTDSHSTGGNRPAKTDTQSTSQSHSPAAVQGTEQTWPEQQARDPFKHSIKPGWKGTLNAFHRCVRGVPMYTEHTAERYETLRRAERFCEHPVIRVCGMFRKKHYEHMRRVVEEARWALEGPQSSGAAREGAKSQVSGAERGRGRGILGEQTRGPREENTGRFGHTGRGDCPCRSIKRECAKHSAGHPAYPHICPRRSCKE